MKLLPHVHVVGGGWTGFGLSGTRDCHVYLLDGGAELALVDTGLGLSDDFSQILDNIRTDGLDPHRIRKIILTHYHGDHIGAALEARTRLDAAVITSAVAAPAIRTADESLMGLTAAKSAGLYPANYQMPACPIDQELDDGDVVSVGELKLHTLATPGHCDGHLSFLLDGVDRPVLIGGDLVFWNGTILIQNVADCRLDAYARSVARVANLNFEALLPGHGQISLKGGRQHAQKAAAMFERLLIPPNVL